MRDPGDHEHRGQPDGDGDPDPACTSKVTDPQKTAIQEVVDANPEVESSYLESSEEAYEKVKEFDFPHKRAALMHCWRDPFFERVLR